MELANAGRAQTQASPPARPSPLEPPAVPGPTSLRLSWAEPYHNGAAISSYVLEQVLNPSLLQAHHVQVGSPDILASMMRLVCVRSLRS